MNRIRQALSNIYFSTRRLLRTILSRKVVDLVKKARRAETSYNVLRYYFFNRVPVPDNIIIDPINICNLSCPFCPTGADKLNYKKATMSFDVFKAIVGKIPKLRYVDLFNWGEPFLNPDIFKMIKYIKGRQVELSIHTNFSFKKDDNFFINLAESGLDYLKISLDGAEETSYSRYRIGGDFNLVISNITSLIRAKRQLKISHPMIIWKFIVNKFNEKEVSAARKMALDLGVKFELAQMGLGDDLPDCDFETDVNEKMKTWLPEEKKYRSDCYYDGYRLPIYQGPCSYLFNSIVISPDGRIFPCCFATDENNTFGDLLKDSIQDIWNNEKYKYSRSLFTGKKYSGPVTETVCSKCSNFQKRK